MWIFQYFGFYNFYYTSSSNLISLQNTFFYKDPCNIFVPTISMSISFFILLYLTNFFYIYMNNVSLKNGINLQNIAYNLLFCLYSTIYRYCIFLMVFANDEYPQPDKTEVLHGNDIIIKKTLETFSRTRKSMDGSLDKDGPAVHVLYDPIWNGLLSLKKKGIKIRCIT